MMKKFVFVSLAFVASMAFAHNCPNEMKAIDAKMSMANLSEADMAKVKSGSPGTAQTMTAKNLLMFAAVGFAAFLIYKKLGK